MRNNNNVFYLFRVVFIDHRDPILHAECAWMMMMMGGFEVALLLLLLFCVLARRDFPDGRPTHDTRRDDDFPDKFVIEHDDRDRAMYIYIYIRFLSQTKEKILSY